MNSRKDTDWDILERMKNVLEEHEFMFETLKRVYGLETYAQVKKKLLQLQQPYPYGGKFGKWIYIAQDEDQMKNNEVKVGFTKDIKTRWGTRWDGFENKKLFVSPFKTDREVHQHLAAFFDKSPQGRETYYGDFFEISDKIEMFILDNEERGDDE